MIIDNPTTFRRTVRGGSMIAAPLILIIAEVLHAHLEEDPSAYLSAIAESTGRWYAAHVLVLVSLVLALPAFLGIRHLIESRRPVLASLGSIAFVPGVIALAALVGMELVAWQMAQPGVDRAQMITLWKNTSQSAGIVPIIFVALLFSLAWLLAGIGLYVTRLCPRWAAALIADAACRLRERALWRPQMGRRRRSGGVRGRPDPDWRASASAVERVVGSAVGAIHL
jgi:hypothetical protein